MYAPNYGSYGQGGQAPPAFNQPGPPHPSQQSSQQQQQQQHMMYNNPQQFSQSPMSSHQNPYGGLPNQSMNPNMAMQNGSMMQNGGMAHMGGNNGIVPPYQTPYSSSPYPGGANPSSSAGPSHQGPFMPPSSNAPQYAMATQSMTPQPHQRMHPPSVGTPVLPNQRSSPYNGGPQSTPPHNSQTQTQFATPQSQTQGQPQPPNQISVPTQHQQSNSNPQSTGIQTPQTPSFPNNAGQMGMAPPLSPGSESREKERVTTLLDINRELLLEVLRLQGMKAEAQKESSTDTAKDFAVEKAKADKLTMNTKEYVDCMRRLQNNLAYLAAIADRHHKPLTQIPTNPAIMTPPVLTILPKTKFAPKREDVTKEDGDGKSDGGGEDRIFLLQRLYKQLQALFPDVKDYTKEGPIANSMAAKPKAVGPIPSGQQSNQPQQGPPQNTNTAMVSQQNQQTPKMPNQSSIPQSNQQAPHSQSAMQAHQQQAQMMARQQLMAQQGHTGTPGGGFNPNMMGMGMNSMSGGGNMQMGHQMGGQMGGQMGMPMMGYGGMQNQPGPSQNPNNMAGPGQGMGLGGMNPNMMGGPQGGAR